MIKNKYRNDVRPPRGQSSLERDSIDYKYNRMIGCALGVIKYLYYPDDEANQTAFLKNDPEGGRSTEAEVEIIHFPKWWKSGSTDTRLTVRIELPPLVGGFDTYEEDIPRAFETEIPFERGQTYPDLDCDYVYVHFLGGQYNRPVFAGYAPHYRANPDRARSDDGARYFKRKNGARERITSTGDHETDLVESNREISVPDLGLYDPTMNGVRQATGTSYTNVQDGGNKVVYLKQGSTVEIVFEDENTPVSDQYFPSRTRYQEVTRLKITNTNGEVALEVPADKVRVKSSSTVTVDAPEVKLGGDAASEGVVRQSDPISYSLTADLATGVVTGSISHAGSSSKVKSE